MGLDLGGLVTLWKGFMASSRVTCGFGLALNLDVSNCAFYKSLPLAAVIDMILGPGKSSRKLESRDIDILTQELVS
jgi:hypothetical protein